MKQTRPASGFGKGIYRAVLAVAMTALMAAVVLPAAAQDEEQPRWFGARFDNRTILAYGIPDSDYGAVHLLSRRSLRLRRQPDAG